MVGLGIVGVGGGVEYVPGYVVVEKYVEGDQEMVVMVVGWC